MVTGAAGFIGSYIAERLKSMGHDVIGIDNFSAYYDIGLKRLNEKQLLEKGISIIEEDLNNPDLINILPKDINYIFHSATQPGISATSTFQDYFENNILLPKT